MKSYRIIILPQALEEIQDAIDYYDEQQIGLGKRFYTASRNTLSTIKKIPFFQVRYDDVRCLLIKGFPFMIHYTVDEASSQIFIHAVIHTSRNPDEYWLK